MHYISYKLIIKFIKEMELPNFLLDKLYQINICYPRTAHLILAGYFDSMFFTNVQFDRL